MWRGWAVAVVLAWWFSRLNLHRVVAWKIDGLVAAWLALALSLWLGWLLQARLAARTRAQALPAIPLLLLAEAAAWLLAAPLALGEPNLHLQPVRACVEAALSLGVVGGTLWLAWHMAPLQGAVCGPQGQAPTLRLALALGVVLAGMVHATFPWMTGLWMEIVLPIALAAAAAVAIGRLRIGSRLLAHPPGLFAVHVCLTVWGVAQVVALVLHFSPIGPDVAALRLAGGTVLEKVQPVFQAVLAWAVLHTLLSLGAPQAPAAVHDPDARARIRRLLEQRRSADALVVYIAALKAQPGFDPGTVAVVPLTKQALKEQRAELALQLLDGFGRRRPADTRTALYLWLRGRALLAAGRVPEGVAQLQALMLHHAGDTHAREARSLLAQQRAAAQADGASGQSRPVGGVG